MSKPALSIVPGLAEITNRVKVGYAEIKRYQQGAVSKATELGDIFLDVKQKLKHGQFLNWIKEDCGLSVSTVERYIILAQHKDLKPNTATTISARLREIEKLTGKVEAEDDDETKAVKAGNRYDKAKETWVKRLSKLRPEAAEAALIQRATDLQAALAEIRKKLPPKSAEQPKSQAA